MVVILISLMFVSSLGQVTSDLYLPSIPAIAKALDVSEHDLQLTITVYMFGLCLSQLIYGPFSDAIGRRKPLIVGLSLCLLGSLTCLVANEWTILMFGRCLQGMGTGAGTALVRSILRDMFDKEELARTNSIIAVSSVSILTLAPIISGVVETYLGWRYNFLCLFLLSIIALTLFLLNIKESNQHAARHHVTFKQLIDNMITILSSRHFLRYALCPLLTYAGILAWLTATPVLLQIQLGISPAKMGWIYAFSGFGFACGALINAKKVKDYGIENMMRLGFVIQILAALILLGFYAMDYFTLWTVALPILSFMMGASLVFPNASAGAFIPFAKIAGTAGAIFGCMQILGGVLSSAILAMSHDTSVVPMGVAMLLSALLGSIVYAVLKPNKD